MLSNIFFIVLYVHVADVRNEMNRALGHLCAHIG